MKNVISCLDWFELTELASSIRQLSSTQEEQNDVTIKEEIVNDIDEEQEYSTNFDVCVKLDRLDPDELFLSDSISFAQVDDINIINDVIDSGNSCERKIKCREKDKDEKTSYHTSISEVKICVNTCSNEENLVEEEVQNISSSVTLGLDNDLTVKFESFKCDNCKKTFPSQSELTEHVSKKHKFTCIECGQVFKRYFRIPCN